MPDGTAPKVEAIDRALVLLSALAEAGPTGAPLADLAERTGLPKPTAYRALTTMRLRGFAEQLDATGHYSLGPAAIALADRSDTPDNLAISIHPALVALSHASHELVHLGVLSGDRVLYVDKVEPERAIRVWSAVGQLVPAASSSLGRALLAARRVPETHLGSYLIDLPPGRAVTPARLNEAVRDAQALGYALELGENEPDVACIGTAILRSGRPVAALSITSLAARMTPARQQELAHLIRSEVPPLLPSGLSLMAPAIQPNPLPVDGPVRHRER